MFGFGKKYDPADVGSVVAENALIYSEPVMSGLVKLGSIDFCDDEKVKKQFGYSLLLNTGAAIIPLVMFHLRNVRFDRTEFLNGAKNYFDSFASVYSREISIQINYQFETCVHFVAQEVARNSSLATTKTFYGNGSRQSVYAEIARFLAINTAQSSFEELGAFASMDDLTWDYVLEVIEGLDRSYRWAIQCVDFSKMKRN